MNFQFLPLRRYLTLEIWNILTDVFAIIFGFYKTNYETNER